MDARVQRRACGVAAAAACLVLSAAATTLAAEPELAWEYDSGPHLPMAAAADAGRQPYLYVALKSGGLRVLDISQSAPRAVASIGVDQLEKLEVMNLAQRGELLLLALGGHFAAPGTNHAGLALIEVSDPRRPRVLSVWKSPEKLQGAAVVVTDGSFAYLGAMSYGVIILDIRDRSNIRHASTTQPDIHYPRRNPGRIQHPNARGLAIRDNILYVANDAGGLRTLDVANRSQPLEIGRYVNSAMGRKQQAYNNVVLEGSRAYVAVDYAGLEIVDISNPRQMRQLGWWNPWNAHTFKNLWINSPGHTNQLSLDRQRELVCLSAGDSELQVVDVSRPQSPRLAGQFGQPKNKLGAWGVATSGELVFLTYIKTVIPFQGTWSGVKAVRYP